MENKINIRFTVNKDDNFINERAEEIMNNHINHYINNNYPMTKKEVDNEIHFGRELFIFNREELEHFINELESKKNYKYEV